MTNRNYMHLVILIAIIIIVNHGRVVDYYKQSSLASTFPYVVNAEEKKEAESSNEAEEVDPQEKELEVFNKDTFIKREVLNQEYINGLIKSQGEKIAYLTFDDGPSPIVTVDILDILKAEEITATFFVLGQSVEEYPHILERIHREGHGVGNHTYSHNYKRIYKNPDLYMEDLLRGEKVIKSVLGEDYDLTLTRFPGGSFGKEAFRRRLNQEGYVYIDWNSLNGDGEGGLLSVEYLLNRFKSTAHGKDVLVILMHDSSVKTTSVDSLPEIINYLKKAGYEFRALPQYIEIEMIRDNTPPILLK